jgi:hypothetical protein
MSWLKNNQQKKDGGKERELQHGAFIEKWWETENDVLGNVSDHFSNIEQNWLHEKFRICSHIVVLVFSLYYPTRIHSKNRRNKYTNKLTQHECNADAAYD